MPLRNLHWEFKWWTRGQTQEGKKGKGKTRDKEEEVSPSFLQKIALQTLPSKNHEKSTCFFFFHQQFTFFFTSLQLQEDWGCRPRHTGGVRGQRWDLLITDLFYSPAVLNRLYMLKWNFSVIFQLTSSWPTGMEGNRRDEMLSFTCNIY